MYQINKAISKYSAKLKARFVAAAHFQRLWRGYKYRRDLRKRRYRIAALRIQCAARRRLARKRVKVIKLKQKALAIISRCVKRYKWAKEEERRRQYTLKYRRQAKQIQKIVRGYIGRRRFERVKSTMRTQYELMMGIDTRMEKLLAGIQLRLVVESMERNMGVRPKTKSGITAQHHICINEAACILVFFSTYAASDVFDNVVYGREVI